MGCVKGTMFVSTHVSPCLRAVMRLRKWRLGGRTKVADGRCKKGARLADRECAAVAPSMYLTFLTIV